MLRFCSTGPVPSGHAGNQADNLPPFNGNPGDETEDETESVEKAKTVVLHTEYIYLSILSFFGNENCHSRSIFFSSLVNFDFGLSDHAFLRCYRRHGLGCWLPSCQLPLR